METTLPEFSDGARLIETFGAQNSAAVSQAAQIIVEAVSGGGSVFIAGNGGSAADAQHFAAELVGRYMIDRPGIRAQALTTDTSILTSIANDYGYDDIFSRQLSAAARPGDIFLAITTSGNSENILRALRWARQNKVYSIGLYGRDGGAARDLTDAPLVVESEKTPLIQQVHAVIVHAICRIVEEKLYGG